MTVALRHAASAGTAACGDYGTSTCLRSSPITVRYEARSQESLDAIEREVMGELRKHVDVP